MAPGRKGGPRSDVCWNRIVSQEVTQEWTYLDHKRGINRSIHVALWWSGHTASFGRRYITALRRSLPTSHARPARQLLVLFKKNHVPHADRLTSFRNHVKLIEKGRTPINSTQPTPAHSSSANNAYPSRRLISQSINAWSYGIQGSGMLRTSFLLFPVGNCHGPGMCSPLPSRRDLILLRRGLLLALSS